ncbi:MAG: hypothetical protein LBF60_07600, partial [Treponema sp.]|nr:hypothetical protein [Treponema sp.]
KTIVFSAILCSLCSIYFIIILIFPYCQAFFLEYSQPILAAISHNYLYPQLPPIAVHVFNPVRFRTAPLSHSIAASATRSAGALFLFAESNPAPVSSH